MSLVINTNFNALFAQEYLTQNQNNLATTQNQLSSGKRITNAAIDPAGLAISQTMQEGVLGFRQGAANANGAVSMVQVASGGMQQTLNVLQQMRSLASEGASGTYSSTQLNDLQQQFNALSNEVNNIANTTVYNGISLLQNSTGSIAVQVGNTTTAHDTITVTLSKTDTTTLAINSSNVSSVSGASSAMSAIDSAITSVTTGIAKLGAAQSNLQYAAAQDSNIADNLNNAESGIADTDYALASSDLARESILNQANVAMLAQANSSPQLALKLLQ